MSATASARVRGRETKRCIEAPRYKIPPQYTHIRILAHARIYMCVYVYYVRVRCVGTGERETGNRRNGARGEAKRDQCEGEERPDMIKQPLLSPAVNNNNTTTRSGGA